MILILLIFLVIFLASSLIENERFSALLDILKMSFFGYFSFLVLDSQGIPFLVKAIPLLFISAAILAQFFKKSYPVIVLFLPVLLALPIGFRVSFFDFEINYNAVFVSFVALSIPLFYLAHYIEKKQKDVGVFSNMQLRILCLGFLTALTFYIGFSSSLFGLIVLSAVLLATSTLLRNVFLQQVSIGFAVFTCAFLFLSYAEIELSVFLNSGFIFGLIIAPFLMEFVRFSKNSFVSIMIVVAIYFILLFIPSKLPIVSFSAMFVGIMLSSASSNLIRFELAPSNKETRFLPLLFVLCGLLIYPLYAPKAESLAAIKKTAVITQEIKTKLVGIPLQNAKGVWQSRGKIDFELGPKGTRTKGQFGASITEITFNDSNVLTQLKVTIDSKSFTTFLPDRDNSLLGSSYIDVNKYPTISFDSKEILKVEETYIVKGVLLFKGLSENVTINLAFTEEGKTLKMTGNTQTDRRKHKMNEDASIGNLVDVNVNLEFIRP